MMVCLWIRRRVVILLELYVLLVVVVVAVIHVIVVAVVVAVVPRLPGVARSLILVRVPVLSCFCCSW